MEDWLEAAQRRVSVAQWAASQQRDLIRGLAVIHAPTGVAEAELGKLEAELLAARAALAGIDPKP